MKRICLILPLIFLAVCCEPEASAQAFLHPGLLSTDSDFARMKFEVSAGAHPWIESYKILRANSHASLNYVDHPVATLTSSEDGSGTDSQLYNDIAAAYADSLVWKITGDTAYADKAVKICDDWSAVLTTISNGDDGGRLSDLVLDAGICGCQFANVAENMRSYNGWGYGANFARFQTMMMTVFYPISHDYLLNHNNLCRDAYPPLWDELSYASVMSIGVLCDNRALYNEAVTYFKNTSLGGGIENSVYQVSPELLGQLQESGNDQKHAGLTIALLGDVCQMAWNQGDDLFSFDNNRFLSGAEYFAKYNLKNAVPFANYTNCQGVVQSAVSSDSRGEIQPIWGLIYNHYANIEGIAAPYSKQYMAHTGSEGGGGNYGADNDGFYQLGYTTLTCTLPPFAGNPIPTGPKASVTGSSVTLGWWGSSTATSYNIGRATINGGPYASLASGVTTTSYVDSTAVPGVKSYYAVSSVSPTGASPYSAPIEATANTQLTGTVIGTPRSNADRGNTIAVAFDGCTNAANWVDSPDPSGDWIGLDLGASYSYVPTQVSYCPRAGFGVRMVGGTFQGSNVADFSSGVTTLYTIISPPPDGVMTTASINTTLPFRYVRYVGPDEAYCNVSEIHFFGIPVANGTYKIINRNSGQALEAAGPGSQVDQSPYNGKGSDQWTVTSLGNGQYKIINALSGQSLDVANSSSSSGAVVDTGSYLNAPCQHFAFIPTDGGYYRIAPAHSAKAIEAHNSSTSTGSLVDQWNWTNDNSQQWILQAL